LSPRGEALYLGMEGEFNLVDFQLANNVYHEAQEPTVMFSSVARDFSDFGAQYLDANILNALNRKGGDLLTPGLEDDRRRQTSKKKRGRKNKYYKQIDHEDDQEANHVSAESDPDGLDGIREEDDDDEEEAMQRRLKLEAARQVVRRETETDAERLRKEKAERDLQAEMAKQREVRATQEQAAQKRR
jgi:hypothetical protein